MGLFRKNKRASGSDKKRQTNRIVEERKHLLNNSKSSFYVREAYKAMRTNVMFSLTGENKCNVLMVTSALQSEGKSTTAINLAISYAEIDKKVLLIDCDMRRPKLARLLAMVAVTGLSNLLMDFSLLNTAVLYTKTENLDVILAGDIPPNPSELLSSQRMQRLLEAMKPYYDYIILDTPPVNMVTDAVVLAPYTDGVLVVSRAGYSERGPMIHAISQLEYVKAKILGFVLNGVDMESTNYRYSKYRYRSYKRYGYGYSRGYGYGYGSHPSQESVQRTTPPPTSDEK